MAGPFETPRLIRRTAWPWGGVLLGRLGGAWSGGRGPWLEAPWGGAGGLGLGGSQTGIPPLTPRLQQARGALTLELPGDPSGPRLAQRGDLHRGCWGGGGRCPDKSQRGSLGRKVQRTHVKCKDPRDDTTTSGAQRQGRSKESSAAQGSSGAPSPQ